MSTCPPPKLLAKMPDLTRLSSSAGSSLQARMKVLVIRGIGAGAKLSRPPLPVGATPISRALSRSCISAFSIDQQSVLSAQIVSVPLDLGGGRVVKKTKK